MEIAVDDLIKESPESSGKSPYPFGLTENQATRLIYFFGSRKTVTKSLGKKFGSRTSEFGTAENLAFDSICSFWNMTYRTDDEKQRCYRTIVGRFRSLLVFLKLNPGYITLDLYRALADCGYRNVLKQVFTAVNSDGKIVVKANTSGKEIVPIGKLETEMWSFQSITFDKMMMIIRSIAPGDISKAKLGVKAKALRDLYSVIHMARLANKMPNMTLMQINVGGADSKEKVLAYSAYVAKNREQG